MRLRAVGIALMVVAVSGCAGPMRPSATDDSTVQPHEIDYVVSLKPASQYYGLDLRYSTPHGGSQIDTWPVPVWKRHIRTKKGVSHIWLEGSAEIISEPPPGSPIESPTAQCTIIVDGAQAATESNPYTTRCEVDLTQWKPSQAPVGGTVPESPTA